MSDRPSARCRLRWLLLLGAGSLSAGCGSESPPTINLLLITLDTCRADRVGPASGLTPALDRLAAGGLRFEHAYTEVPITLPAHASLLTGLYPPLHGVRNNAPDALGDIPTLAERLRDSGFSTAAFVSSEPLARGCGLERGFTVYDDELPPRAHDYLFRERPGRETVSQALEWIETHRKRWEDSVPFFVWVHHFGPHQPYRAPEPWQSDFRDRPYDGEIRAADDDIGRLLDRLRGDGLLDQTLVVFTADHGEGLGEFEATHGYYLYDPTLRIPLILSGPGVPRGKVSTSPAGLVDIVPTVHELLGLPLPGRLSGASLLGTRRARLYSESLYCYRNFGWSPLTASIDRAGKLVDGGSEQRWFTRELEGAGFDETTDRRDADPEDFARRLAQLRAQEAHLEARATEFPEPRRVPRDLAALGYLSGEPSDAEDPTLPRRSPLASHDIVDGLDIARRLLSEGSPLAALARLRKLEAIDASNPEIPFWRGRTLARISTLERSQDFAREARAAYLRVLELRPGHHQARLLADWQLVRLGDFEAAHASLHGMLRGDSSQDSKTWELYARLLATERAELDAVPTNALYDPAAARVAAEAAVKYDPSNESARELLSVLPK